MKTIKVCVYKKDYPTYIKRNELEDSFQNNHLLIFNLTEEQKSKVLELLGTFGEIVTETKTKDYEKDTKVSVKSREANNLPFFMQEPPSITPDDSRPNNSNYTNKLNLNSIMN